MGCVYEDYEIIYMRRYLNGMHDLFLLCFVAMSEDSSQNLHFVIARYNENVGWVKKLDPARCKHVIYNKGADDLSHLEFNVVHLRNIGREAQTYLYHIITHYDALEGDIVFLQGHPFDHLTRTLVGFEPHGFNTGTGDETSVINFFNTFHPPCGFFPLGCWFACDTSGRPHLSYDLQGVFKEFFEAFNKKIIWYVPGAQFIVSADVIKRRPKEFYMRLYQRGSASGWNEFAYVMERMWYYIFNLFFLQLL